MRFPPGTEAGSGCGISAAFAALFPTRGQVTHVLLTRPPLAGRSQPVRLACIRRAASVRPEPGSNSPDEMRALPHGERRFRRYHPLPCGSVAPWLPKVWAVERDCSVHLV